MSPILWEFDSNNVKTICVRFRESTTEDYKKALFDLILRSTTSGVFQYIDESAKLGKSTLF